MTDQALFTKQPASLDDLFRAAQVLLNCGTELHAVQVLHAQIATSLRPLGPMSVPPHYASPIAARQGHEQLLSEWNQRATERASASPLRELWNRRPHWFAQAGVAIVLLLLTLRYAWAVTYGKNWAQQHPEGNWISRFYRNDTFEGYPLLRYDVGVNADFGPGAPADAVKKDYFSARWDTCLVVTQHVVVPVELDSDDSSKFFLDEQLVFEVAPGPGQNSALVTLQPGLRHVRVDFNERGGMAMVRLLGFELEGTESYSFRRPMIEGEELRCR